MPSDLSDSIKGCVRFIVGAAAGMALLACMANAEVLGFASLS